MRYFILVGTLLLFSQCTSSKFVNYKRPQRVAHAYYQALQQRDFERLLRLGTPEMQGTINLLRNMYQLMPIEGAKEVDGHSKLKAVKKVTCQVQGNTAVCKACCVDEEKGAELPLTLKKINEQWLVHWEPPQLGQAVQ